MRTIWKFPLKMAVDSVIIDLPRGARIVHFAFEYRGPLDQGPRTGTPTLWAEVDPAEPAQPAEFRIFGTGHPLPDGASHVATWDAEPFVWHLYDMRFAVELPDEIAALPQDAQNAYRVLMREGFRYQPVEHDAPVWLAGDDEPVTMEQTMALATLAEYGLGTLVE